MECMFTRGYCNAITLIALVAIPTRVQTNETYRN